MAHDRPREHVLRELGFTVVRAGEEELRGTAAVVPEMHVPGTSALRTSVLAVWADMLTGLLAVDVFQPRVPVTLQLDVNLVAPPADLARVNAVGRRIKAGRAAVVATVEFTDDCGSQLGLSTGLFMVAPDPALMMPLDVDPLETMATAAGPLRRPLAERAGCVRRSPGVAELPRTEEGLNASGTVNGGLLALTIEEAALSAFRPGSTLSMIAMRYLRPVRVGPAVAVAEVHGGLAEILVHDGGRDAVLAVSATTRVFGA